MIQIGQTGTAKRIVTESDTAAHIKSGTLPVLATPVLSALMEEAAVNGLVSSLKKEETTVGGYIAVTHKAPTLPGQEIRATATVTAAEGRKISFSITAFEDEKEIGTAEHIRFIVNEKEFLKRLRPAETK